MVVSALNPIYMFPMMAHFEKRDEHFMIGQTYS